MTIRQDEQQWLIYQEQPVTGVVGAVEIILMILGAAPLVFHEDEEVRALGHAGAKIATTRLNHWKGELRGLEPTELQATLAGYINDVIDWLAQDEDNSMERPDQALDELRAAIVWIDKRGRAAGVSGDGWYREILRESTIAK